MTPKADTTKISSHIGKDDTPNSTALKRSTLYVKGLNIITGCKRPAVSKEKKAPDNINMGITIKVCINPKD